MKKALKIESISLLLVFYFSLIILISCQNSLNDIFKLPFKKSYTVIFKDNPDIISKKIFYKGFEIGNIAKQELNRNGKYVVLKIKIDNKYDSLITTNSTFYVEDQKLEYTTLGEKEGEVLAEGSQIYGFNSLNSLNWFMIKEWINRKSKNFQELMLYFYMFDLNAMPYTNLHSNHGHIG